MKNRVMVALAVLVLLAAAAEARPTFTLTDLVPQLGEGSVAVAVSQTGLVLVNTPSGPVVYDSAAGTVVAGPYGDPSMTGAAIDSAGDYVGTYLASGQNHAYLVTADGTRTDLGTLGGTEAYALGINDNGQVVGRSTTVAHEMHAFLWNAGVLYDLGPADALQLVAHRRPPLLDAHHHRRQRPRRREADAVRRHRGPARRPRRRRLRLDFLSFDKGGSQVAGPAALWTDPNPGGYLCPTPIFGVDLAGNTLVMRNRNGTARWFDASGNALTDEFAVDPRSHAEDFHFLPDGSLVSIGRDWGGTYRWLARFPDAQPVVTSDVPGFLQRYNPPDFSVVRSGGAYLVPLPQRDASAIVSVASGRTCGTIPTAGRAGRDGTVMKQTARCGWRLWPQLLQ